MIDISALRRLAETGPRHVDIDHRGALVDRGELDADGPAILVAVPVTDAVKVVAEGLVRDSLDREKLWSIEGFRLDREVISVLDETVTTCQSLIDAVAAAGFNWQTIEPTTGVL